jgi:RHS repeat-associated protein
LSSTPGPQLPNFQFGDGFRRRTGYDYSIGGGGSVPDTSAAGHTLSMYVPPDRQTTGVGYSASVALQMGRSEDTDDLIDINGDGLPDLVQRRGRSINVRYNLGNQFGALETIGTLDATMNGAIDTFQSLEQATTPSLDTTSNALSHETTLTEDDSTTLDVVFVRLTRNTHQTSSRITRQLVDLNGDGLPDLLLKQSNQPIQVQFNRGGDFGASQPWTTPSWGTLPLGPSFSSNFASLLLSGTHVVANNDVLAGTSSQSSRTYTGEVVFPLEVVNLHVDLATTDADDTYELALVDVDGDGAPDHVLRRGDVDQTLHVKRNQITGRANLLQTVHRPLGGSFTLDYTWAGNTQDMPHRRQVLSRVEVDDGVDYGSSFASPNLVTTFAYDGGYYHRNEKTFMGFSKVTTFRADGGYIEQFFENHSLPLMGHLTRETRHGLDYLTGTMRVLTDRSLTTMVVDVVDGSNTVIGATPECLAALPGLLQRIGDEACRPKLSVLVEDDSTQVESGGLKTHIVHVANLDASGVPQIDRFGNVLNSTDEVDDNTPTDDVYAEAQYLNLTSRWVLGIPIRLVVRYGGPTGGVLRSRSGLPDLATGDLTSITVQTGTSGGAKTLLTYDPSYGTLSTITTPANKNGDVQTYTIKYDSSTQTYPISVTNAFGDVSATSYDVRFGIATVETDPSQARIIRTVDSFGRVHTVASNQDPTNTYTLTMDYYPTESPPRAVTTAHGSAVSTYTGPLAPTTTSAVFTDGLGRTIETRDSANVGGSVGTTTSGAVQRDNMGHVTASYQPFFNQGASTAFVTPAVTPATITGYDSFDRARSLTYPDTLQAVEKTDYDIGVAPSGCYLFHTTVTEPNTHYRDMFTDSANRTLEYVEHADSNPAVTTYDYLPTGELALITDAEGNQTSFQYDLRGLQLAMTSPDAGTVMQTFDDMGNRTSLTDANHANASTTVNYTYSYDRLMGIDYPTKPDVTFAYSKGRIRTITDETGTRTFTYGSLGEVTDDLRVIKRFDGASLTFDTKFTYDTLGRLLQIVYPEGTSVTNAYDEGGKLASVTGSGANWSRVYADQIRYDVFGNRTQIHYGNNVLTTEAYEPLRVRLSSVLTALPSGDQVQNLQYQYDPSSNPTKITNTLPALTSSSGNRPGQSTLSLTYDGADQLLTAAGSADLDAATTTNYTETTHYSASHNISTKQRVHQIVGSTTTSPPATNFNSTYTYDSGHAHLPSLIAPTTYDANGNATGSNSISYDWNGNPTQRSDTSGSLQTLVWDDDSRLTQVNGSFGTQTNLYDAGGLRVRRDSGTQHTIFESPYFDLEGTNQSIKHIYAGGTRVASVLDTNFVGGANPAASTTSGTPYFFHDDHLGSTTVVTTDAGAVQESHEYFSDGELWIDRTPQPAQNRYLFNGKPFDRDTGFYDFGQRFYDPRSGLWLGEDPAFLGAPGKSVGRPMMLATSAFAGQSPERNVDPDGRDYPQTAAGQALYLQTYASNPWSFQDPKNFNWDRLAASNTTPSDAARHADDSAPADWLGATSHMLSETEKAAAIAATAWAISPAAAVSAGGLSSLDDLLTGISTGDRWKIVGGASGLLLLGAGGGANLASDKPVISTTSTAGARFLVTPDGVAIPTNPEEVLGNMSKLKDVSTNPSSSRKFTGTDSKGPIRVRIEKAHPEDPSFTGEPDPLHTVDHMHIDRRANGTTGPWTSKEKIQFTWPF